MLQSIFFIMILICLLLSAISWVWLMWEIRKTGYRKTFGGIALQISASIALFYLIKGSAFNALWGFFLPYSLLSELNYYSKFQQFISNLLIYSIPIAFIVGVAFLLSYKTRIWTIIATSSAFLISSVMIGEAISLRMMCQTAIAVGVEEIERNSLLWSLQNTPQEFQFDVHALLTKDDEFYGWSYRELNWYKIPAVANADVGSDKLIQCQQKTRLAAGSSFQINLNLFF